MQPPPEPRPASGSGPNPWYLRPFFGKAPALPVDARRILRLVALGLFFENYDLALLNAALPQISRELGIAAGDTGFYVGAIRLGGVGTFLLLPFADRLGRRRVFLAAFIGMGVGTLLSGLSQTPLQFTLAQVFSRSFLLLAGMLALVMVVEEFPADRRGAGLGLLSLLGGLGYGVCALLYAWIDVLPYGWRLLYGFGVLPLILLPFFRRSLRETRRFEQHRLEFAAASSARTLHAWVSPLLELLRANPRRALGVGLAALLGAVGQIGFFQYTSLFVQEMHGWSPSDYTVLVILGGAIGIFGSIVGGRGSDRFGRRGIGAVGYATAPIFAALFFMGPSGGLVVAWGCFVFFSSAGEVVLRALAAELFPTSHRGTATGWFMLVQTLGWSGGLMIVGFAVDSVEDLGPILVFLSLGLVLAAAALRLLPETHQRELETLGED
jgi:MFS family permease